MPPQSHSLTLKQESFCMAYMDTMNASEAYRRSYNAGNMKDETVWRRANELLKNSRVTARLEELRRPVIEQARLTLEGHLQSLLELRDKAEAAEKYGPAIQAEIARGKAAGFYTNKIEVSEKPIKPVVEMDTRELLSIISQGKQLELKDERRFAPS